MKDVSHRHQRLDFYCRIANGYDGSNSVERRQWGESRHSRIERVPFLSRLLDHIVCAGEQERGIDVDRLGGLQIDGHMKLRRLFDWEIAGVGPLEDFVHEIGGAAKHGVKVDA